MNLVQPIIDFVAGIRRLTIIPDKQLAGIPFETLVRNDSMARGYKGIPYRYLIEDFEIVYRTAFDCPEKIGQVTTGADTAAGVDNRFAIVGFAPDYGINDRFTQLPACRLEVRKIGAMFHHQGLSSWLVGGNNIDKELLRSVIGQGKIVHLAAHFIPVRSENKAAGFVLQGSDPDTGLSTGPECLLSPEEISGFHLDADLVVLSGCGTGTTTGNTTNSSLPASMPQCWLNAGAHNIISTMWNVTDNLTGKFMVDFYRAWLSGKTYSEALRDVKLQWINRRETSLPSVWAPYVLTECK